MMESSPLIVTLQLDPVAFTFFNELRQKHFPPAINYLEAHLTLFHHLPAVPEVRQLLETVASKQEQMPLEVVSVMKLGRGVAYKMKSESLLAMHHYLQTSWQNWLTPQDRQKLNPHVTVQNKVATETAHALYQELAASFNPFTATGTGLSLWEYKGGPWHKFADYSFQK
jgi:hypothetical protein